MRLYKTKQCLLRALIGLMALMASQISVAEHDIRGIEGPTFDLYSFPFNMNLPDGSSIHMWGFGDMNAGAGATHSEGNGYNAPQYPGPTLIVDQGQAVTINLTNYGVPRSVNIVVGGHDVTSSSAASTPGLLADSAAVGQTVAYSFVANEPGTYFYHSVGSTNPGLHDEMGLVGVFIVRPTGFGAGANRTAYGIEGTDYDQEFLYLLTEIDPEIHAQVERGHFSHFTHSNRYATIWLVNGRVFPDLFQGDFNTLFPHQPYEAIAKAHPRDRVLVRELNLGSDSHPFHHHGENLTFIGRDGRPLSSDGLIADLGRSDNTLNSAPKQAVDMIWTWSGKNLNWDIYGPVTSCTDADHNMEDDLMVGVMCHDATCLDVNPVDDFDDVNGEYCPDHTKPVPVSLPGVQDLTLGGWWSGSPFLGATAGLPPGEGGLNPFGGYFLVWHSHAEKELTTFDIFPGGSLSTVVVVPPYLPID